MPNKICGRCSKMRRPSSFTSPTATVCTYCRRQYKRDWEKRSGTHYLRQKRWRRANPEKNAYNQTLTRARRKGIECRLSWEEFQGVIQKPCDYCGTSDELRGVDRIDSSKGYVAGNVASACTVCNKMKLHYSLDFFLTHIGRIARYRGEIQCPP